jgi:hypothetical protein
MAGFFKGLLRPFKDCPEFKEFREGEAYLMDRPRYAKQIITRNKDLLPSNQQKFALDYYNLNTYKKVGLFIATLNKYVFFEISLHPVANEDHKYNVKFTKKAKINGEETSHECVVDSDKIDKLIDQGLWHIPYNCYESFEDYLKGDVPGVTKIKLTDLPKDIVKINSAYDLDKLISNGLNYNAYMTFSRDESVTVTFTILYKNYGTSYTLTYNNKQCDVDRELIESMIRKGVWIRRDASQPYEEKPAQEKPAQAKPPQEKPPQEKPAQAKPAQAKPANISFSHIIPPKKDNPQWWKSVKNKYGVAGETLANLLVDYTINPQFPRSKRELKLIFIFFSKIVHSNKGGTNKDFIIMKDAYDKIKDQLEEKEITNQYEPIKKDNQPDAAGGKRHTRCNTHRNTRHGKKVSQRTQRKKHTLRKQRKQRK